MSPGSLTNDESSMVAHLLQVTGLENEQQAIELLTRAGWNLERAVDSWAASGPTSNDRNNMRRRRVNDEASQGGVQGGAGAVDRRQSEQPEEPGILGKLLGVLLSPLRVLTGINGDIDTRSAAQEFVREFEGKYGRSGSPNFVDIPYREALAQASKEDKLLFVYLHCPQHPDTDRFCQNLLCSPGVCDLINGKMVAWGGRVEFAEAYRLSGLLSACTYPYVAILEPPASSKAVNAKLLERVEGQGEFATILFKLVRATDQHGSIIAERTAQRYEATERQRLREEQDQALQEAMETDRRREAERKQKEEEEARLKREEEEEKRRVEEEAAKSATEKKTLIDVKRARVMPEPEYIKGQVTAIRFQLPNGQRFQRRFKVNDTLENVRDYVDCELFDRESEINNYALVLNFPKKTFAPGDHEGNTKYLSECDMVPQAVLFIQDLDS
mmetsp:Transcript_26387/g.42777  ORF Transcript_26387/g.42777 Transcript_26387/m.42777 type:complete len:442 (+) Transcript_26387:132-1457(+)